MHIQGSFLQDKFLDMWLQSDCIGALDKNCQIQSFYRSSSCQIILEWLFSYEGNAGTCFIIIIIN